ncbi:MAG: DUF1761 domain-containing protein [Bacteroidota bacterium]|nr:DUF1761 domain-containing protein [Bacteroidota bacterium]
MNTKKIFISGLTGTIVYFLLGWLFYGILFTDIYPSNGEQNLVFVFLGCMIFAFLLAYVIVHLANINSLMGGLKTGLIIGFLNGLSMNFFMFSTQELNTTNFIYDVAINAVIGALTGASIGFVNKSK